MAILKDHRKPVQEFETLPLAVDSGVLSGRVRFANVTIDPVEGLIIADVENASSSDLKWEFEGATSSRIAPGSSTGVGEAKLVIDVNPDLYFTEGRFHINVYELGGASAEFRARSTTGGSYFTFNGFPTGFIGVRVGGHNVPDAVFHVMGDLGLDNMTAPASYATGGKLYIDAADGDLKIKWKDGTVTMIVAGPV